MNEYILLRGSHTENGRAYVFNKEVETVVPSVFALDAIFPDRFKKKTEPEPQKESEPTLPTPPVPAAKIEAKVEEVPSVVESPAHPHVTPAKHGTVPDLGSRKKGSK